MRFHPRKMRNMVYFHFESACRRFRFRKERRKHYRPVTIIGNDCLPGIIYNTLGQPFISPTINLVIPDLDFIIFVHHLPSYCQAELKQDNSRPSDCPLGILVSPGLPNVHLLFVHYKSFEEAKDAWIRRCKRIDWDRIFLAVNAGIWHEILYVHRSELYDLAQKYGLAIVVNSSPNTTHYERLVKQKIKNGVPIPICYFQKRLGRRYMDDADFVNAIYGKKNGKN